MAKHLGALLIAFIPVTLNGTASDLFFYHENTNRQMARGRAYKAVSAKVCEVVDAARIHCL